MAELPNQPWTLSSQEILNRLDVSADEGLSESAVQDRREQYGENRLQEAKKRSAWQILIEQFKSLIIGLLAIAAAVSFAFRDWVEGIALSA